MEQNYSPIKTSMSQSTQSFVKILLFSFFLVISNFAKSQLVTIGSGTATQSFLPIYSCYGYNYSQQIYTAAEISAAGGNPGSNITTIAFRVGGTAYATANFANWTIYLGNTALNNFASTAGWVPSASMTPVWTGNIPTLTANGWMTITLTTPFNWSGGNLVVAVDENTPSWTCTQAWYSFTSTAAAGPRSILYYNDATNPNPAAPPTANYSSTTVRPQVQFNMVSTVACSGVPNAGAASITSSAGCVGANVTLSASGLSIGSGISYQWQSGPTATGPWTNIPGATNSVYGLTTVTGMTYYRLTTFCLNSASSASTNVVSYNANVVNSCTCLAYGASTATSAADEDIFNVSLGSLNNSSTCATTAGGAGSVAAQYSNYTGVVAAPILSQGASYPLSLTLGYCGSTPYSNMAAVYIDYNQNGLFTDAGETVYTKPYGAGTTPSFVVTGTVTIPMTATAGLTRMRVVYVESSVISPTGNYSWGETEDYCVEIAVAAPCSGVPNASTATITSTGGCPNTNFTLSSLNYTYGLGISYQWQSSPNGVTSWTNITGATSINLTTSTATTMYYRLVTSCLYSASSNQSNVVSYAVAGDLCQCAAYPSSVPTYNYYSDITNVTVGGINNSSTCSTLAPGPGSVLNRYSNYTGSVSSGNLLQGQVATFSLTSTGCLYGGATNFFQIYVDFNQDGDFLDAGELCYYQPANAAGDQTLTGAFIVPPTASIGITRMRIVNVNYGTAGTYNYGTYAYSYGETEDYCVTIAVPPPCAGTPTPGNTIANPTSVFATQTTLLTLQNATTGTGITYQWQSAPSSTGPWTNITGATSYQYTATPTASTWYQCVVTCSNSASSGTSNPVQVLYNPYCNPAYIYGTQYGDLISNVAIPTTTLNNNSGTGTTGPYYTYYSNIPAPTLQAATSYQLQVTAGSFTNQSFAAWIDYNDNFIFEPSEKIGFSTAATTASFQMVAFQINLACTPPLGVHRMRVRGVYATAGSSIDPCATYYYGETEDYNVNIVAGAPFTPTFTAVPTPSSCTLTSYTYTTQSGMQNYTWVIPGVAGVDYTVISGGTTTSNSLVIQWLTGGNKTVSVNYLNASGCASTGPVSATVTVQSTIAVAAITGTQTVCSGSQVTFATPTTGGTWSSSNTAVATIDVNTGVITGVGPGTATMTYSVPNVGSWCPPSTATRTITVLPVPVVNAGPDVSICAGASTGLTGSVVFNTSCNQTITLYDSYGDGWNGCTATVLVGGVPVLSNITLPNGAGPLSFTFSATNGQAIQVTFTAASWPYEPYFTITNGAGTNLVTNYYPYASGTWNGVASGCPSITPVWTPAAGLSSTTILNPVATPTATQVYTMSATASNGCTISDQVQVTVQPLPVVTIANQTVATFCNGGSVVLAPTPTAQTYAWSQGATAVGSGSTYTATTSGNYSLIVTNFYPTSGISCSSLPSNPITVTVNPNPNTAITPSGSTSICQGSSVNLTAGATNSTPVSYLWSNGATTSNFVATAAGPVSVSVTNNFGCTATSAPTTISVLPLPVATITPTGSTTFCAGGTVALNASSGTSYLWSPGGATTQTLNATTAGNYTVAVTGANGCTATSAPMTVDVLPAPANAPIAGQSTLCLGNAVSYTNPVSGGVWSSSNASIFSVNAGSGSGIGSGIGSATISYTTTGANGCTATQSTSVTVTGTPVASISTSGSTAICQGNTVTLTANPAQSYLWNNNATTQSITVSNGGAYSVVISNGPGCSSAASAPTTVTVNALPVAAISANGSTVFCQGGSVNLTASGGTSYSWNNTSTGTTLTASTSGNYFVTVTDANGCQATSNTIAVTVNALPTATITANGPTSFCQGSNVVLTAAGNGAIVWTNNQNTPSITVANSGNYAYTITDANGCTATATPTTVTVSALPVVPSITGANNVCSGASTLFANTMTGGTWSSSNASIATVDALGSVSGSNVGSATISYQVTQNGCSATATKVINVQAAPIATISALGSTSFCIGSNVTLVSSPGVSYAWSNGATSQNVTLNTAGPITVQVTGTNGCSATSAPQTITVNPLPVLDPIAGASVVCVASTGTLSNTTGGGTWSSANTNIASVNPSTGVVSGNAAGTANITYTYTNNNGCTSSVSAPVVIQALPSAATTVAGSTVFCQGGSVTLSAPAASSYLWTPSGATTQSISATTGGTYTVQVTSGACSATSPATVVTVHALPVATISSTATAICQGGSVTLTAAPASSYSWSNGATTQSITVTSAGNYGVTVSNIYGCTSTSAPTTINVSALPASFITASGPTTFCNGSSVILSANTGTSYVWSNGATTQNITANASGNYFVTITNAAGCSSVSNEIQVNAQQTFVATATAVGPTAVCDGAFVTLVASPGSSYLWSNGATTQGINAGVNGNYSVTVTNALGCSSTSTNIPVTILPVPTAGITTSGPTTFCEGGSVVLTGTGGNTYIWNSSLNGSNITVTQGGTYVVTAYGANGCSDAAEVVVTVNESPSPTLILNGNTVLCPGESLVISAQPNNTYAWSNNATTQSITVTSPGTYSAVLTNLTGCTSNSDVVTVTAGAATSSTINATGYSSYTLNEVVYTQSGTYTQTLTNAAGCDSTITLNLTLTVGIEEGNITDVNLYPNPTSESFTIKTSAPIYGTFSIVDAQGKLVFSGEMTGTDTHVNISSVARGIYYLRIPELSEPLRVVKN